MVHSGYHPLNDRTLDSTWMVHSGYHPLIVVLDGAQQDIILLGQCTVDVAQWISSSQDSTWMVHSGYHPLKHSSQDSTWMVHSGYHPLKYAWILTVISSLGWCWMVDIILDIILLGQYLDGAQWISSSPLRIVLGWCTVDIILLGQYLDGAQWISSSQDSAWMVHSGYHPLKPPLRIVLGWCTVDIILLGQSSQDSAQWMVHSGYHPLKYHPLRIVLGWCTVDIILLRQSLDGAQWISSSQDSHPG